MKFSLKRFHKFNKASFTGRRFRSGVYVTAVSAIVIGIIIVINMFISQMGLKIDLTSRKLYTLSEETKDLLQNMDEDLTLYLLAQTGNEETDFVRIAQEYERHSKHIKLVLKDPILYPKFASKYVEEEVSQNSFLVVNNETDTAKYIAYHDMIETEFDYNTFQSHQTGIDVEGEVTSAIAYVTNPDLPLMYVVEGHGEREIGQEFKLLMDRLNIQVETLSTLTKETIPEDCDILFINTPTSDFSDEEVSMIKDYMAAGGNAIITLNYKSNELANFKSILDYYGVEVTDGIIVEGDADKFLPGYPHFLIPDTVNHEITNTVKDKKVYVIAPVSSGLSLSETTRSSLNIDPLLETSDTAYSKINVYSDTMSKEDGDIQGPFYLGLLASDTYDNTSSNLAVFSTEMMFDDSMLREYGNGDILTATMKALVGDESTIVIPAKRVVNDYIYITQQQGILWGALAVIVIPVGVLATGIVVNMKRRKK